MTHTRRYVKQCEPPYYDETADTIIRLIITPRRSERPAAAGARCAAKCMRAEGQGAPAIGTARRMMDHHACPKTRWDSAQRDEEC